MKYSLFIGRWQPFHDGHKKLIQSVLDEGKNICVAIRDTEITETDPYTAEERQKMIADTFPQVKIIIIPDIEEVVYGRKVGWGIRELRLDPKIESISGTEIRKQNNISITWITGNSDSGKTTLAKKMLASDGGILLDGDDMRTCWKLGFSKEDRVENNLRIARIAKVLNSQGFNVVVATICPYIQLRQDVKEITNCRFIYLEGGKEGKDYPYEK